MTPFANPTAIFRAGSDGWAVLVNTDTAGSVALDAAGIVVWKLIDGRRSAEAIVAAVRRHFRDAPDTVADDVVSLLDTLAEEGLVGYEEG
jgi:hypothetical protein